MGADKAAADFGGLVRSIRKERKLKSWEVAERVNIEVKYLGRIERGEKRPSFELIIALAETLSVSPARFFAFDSTPTDPKALKNHIVRQLRGRDVMQLHRASRLLTLLFDSK